jgi:hypothetical protein
MPITEGNPTEGTAPTQQAPAIDYDAIGAAVARSISQSAPPKEQVSAFQQAIASIEADPENDKETLQVLSRLFEANRQDLDRAAESKINQMLVQERVRQASSTLEAEIKRIAESDEALAPFADAVRVLAIQEFDKSEDYNKHRAELIAGSLDPAVLRKLASKHFTKFSEAGKKSQSGVTGMAKSEGGSEAAAKAAAESKADVPTFDSLSEKQRELYYSILQEQQRAGLKKLGLTQEQAEKEALSRASKKFR